MVTGAPGVSRRQLLGASGAAAAAAGLAACGGSSSSSPVPRLATLPTRLSSEEEALINGLIDVEYHAAAAYIAAIPVLKDHNLRAAKRFLRQELSHASELAAVVKAGHGKPHVPVSGYQLGHPRGTKQVMELLHGIERLAISAYLDAIGKLTPGPLRAVAVSILANEAQHMAIVRRNLGLNPVPAALVTGAE